MTDLAVLSLISCAALATAITSLVMAGVVLRRLELQVKAALANSEKIYDMPKDRGGVAFSSIAAVIHDVDGFNVWVYLKSGHGAALCLTWADGVELEQAWREWQRRQL